MIMTATAAPTGSQTHRTMASCTASMTSRTPHLSSWDIFFSFHFVLAARARGARGLPLDLVLVVVLVAAEEHPRAVGDSDPLRHLRRRGGVCP